LLRPLHVPAITGLLLLLWPLLQLAYPAGSLSQHPLHGGCLAAAAAAAAVERAGAVMGRMYGWRAFIQTQEVVGHHGKQQAAAVACQGRCPTQLAMSSNLQRHSCLGWDRTCSTATSRASTGSCCPCCWSSLPPAGSGCICCCRLLLLLLTAGSTAATFTASRRGPAAGSARLL